MIPRGTIEEIVARSDIVSVIGQYVQLKSAGSNMVGLCPFHSEKSPSFTVFKKSDSFYCFGCGAGGDVISFIKRQENLDYADAVRFLAQRCGVTVPEDNTYTPGASAGPSRERVRDMNTEACKYFHACLINDPGAAAAREYLAGRSISAATIKHFYLGYAPGGDGLLRHLRSKGYKDDEMIAAFLARRNEKGRVYSLFFNRVIFPIVDTSRNIVAFGGRVLDGSKPKYLNTSDTAAFKKSRTLFALNYAKDSCQENLIMCEGYMDVVTMHQAGFTNSVATLGTAITEEHARIISRYTKRVILSYDSDEAGRAATDRAMRALGSVGTEVRVLHMEGAKDPDEYIKKFGRESFQRLIESASTGFEFHLGAVASKYNLSVPEDCIRASKEITGVIAGYNSGVERDLYIKNAAARLNVSPEALKSDVEAARRKNIRLAAGEANREAHTSISHYGEKANPDAAADAKSASLEEIVIGLMLIYPEHREAVVRGDYGLEPADFFTSLYRRAFEAITALQVSEGGFVFSLLDESFSESEISMLKMCEIRRSQMDSNGTEVFADACRALKKHREAKENAAGTTLADTINRRRQKLADTKKGVTGS